VTLGIWKNLLQKTVVRNDNDMNKTVLYVVGYWLCCFRWWRWSCSPPPQLTCRLTTQSYLPQRSHKLCL